MSADLVRGLFDDFNRGDFEAALAKLHDDVEWGEPPDIPDTGGTYHGHAGVREGFARFMGAWEVLSVDLDELVETNAGVVAATRWRGQIRGLEVDQRVAQLYELRDGKVARVTQYRTVEEALKGA